MADEMEAFLTGNVEAEPAPEAPPEPQVEAAPDPKPEPAPDDSEGDEQHALEEAEPADEVGIRKALAAERDKRRDWKEKAIRAEGEMAELRRQLEEARKAPMPPPAPPQQFQPQPIDPNVDPQGFVSRVQEVVLNERLNTSEMMARQQYGAEAIETAINDFKEAAKSDPSLFPKLYANPHPYDWMVKEVERQRLLRDVGSDPAAYRAKLEAELRAKLEAEIAERTQAQPQPSAAPRLAPSLATARSAAPRSAPAFTGPPPLDALFGS
jgi:hypothetical protein